MDGRPFGFVAALDVMGSWPPRQDLHLEMDAAFAAYYAWVRMQAGECDTAIVVGHGKTSEGEPERVLNLQLDPYYQAPLGLDADLDRGAAGERLHGAHRRDRPRPRRRSRRATAPPARAIPTTQVRDAASADELQQTPWAVEPLRRGYLPPIGESAICLVLAAEGKAEKLCDRPVWIHGVDHRTELQTLGARDLTRSAERRAGGARRRFAMAGLGERARRRRGRAARRPTPAEELIVCEALGLDAHGDRSRRSIRRAARSAATRS